MLFFKKNGKEETATEPPETVLTWGNRDLQQAMLTSSRCRVAAELAHISYAYDKAPEEVLERFTKLDEGLQDWFSAAPLKAELKEILDALYPEPPGYDPGETLVPEPQRVPRHHTARRIPKAMATRGLPKFRPARD